MNDIHTCSRRRGEDQHPLFSSVFLSLLDKVRKEVIDLLAEKNKQPCLSE